MIRFTKEELEWIYSVMEGEREGNEDLLADATTAEDKQLYQDQIKLTQGIMDKVGEEMEKGDEEGC